MQSVLTSCSLSSFSSSQSCLIDISLEATSEYTTHERTEQVHWEVDESSSWGIWIGMTVHNFLVEWLGKTDSWVNGTTGNSRSDLDSGVESNTNAHGVDWHVFGSVVLNDLENESNEEESHNHLNKEYFAEKFSTIIASINWAKLGDVVGSSSWEFVFVLWENDES
jgi:hypothetical protein